MCKTPVTMIYIDFTALGEHDVYKVIEKQNSTFSCFLKYLVNIHG